MCMIMYVAPRRVRWGSTYSYAVRVGQGVRPGCTAAIYLLQLVMITPFDVFVASTSHVPRSIDVYADDVTVQVVEHISTIVGTAIAMLSRLAVVLQALQLPIARDKAKVVSSDTEVAKQVVQGTKQHGFQATTSLNILGMEARAGRPISSLQCTKESGRS